MHDRKSKILLAALDVIIRYGYRRSSMEDYALAAGVSRPALYQYFRNKQDVFLSCLDMVIETGFAKANEAAANVAATNIGATNIGAAKEKVAAFLAAYMAYYYRITVAGPHGMEIQTVNTELGREKTDRARLRLIERLNQLAWLPVGDEAGDVLADASEGLKMRAPDEETLTRRVRMLVLRVL